MFFALATAGFLASGAPALARVEGNAVRLVDPRSGSAIASLDHGSKVSSVSLQGDFVLTRGAGRAVLWTAKGEKRFSLAVPDRDAVVAAQDGRALVIYDKGLWVVAAPSGARVRVFKDPRPARLALGGALIGVRMRGGELSMWNAAARKLVARRRGVGEIFALSPDGARVAFSDSIGVHVGGVDGKDDALLSDSGADSLDWAGEFLAACGRQMRIWNARARVLENTVEAAGECAVSSDGRAALVGEALYELRAPDRHTDGAGIFGALFTPNGTLVTLGSQGKVATWELPGAQEHASGWVKPAAPCGATALAVSGDGRTFAAPGHGSARVWALTEVGLEPRISVPGTFAAAALTGDGKTLALSAWPARLLALDLAGKLRWKDKRFACALAGSPDGKLIAAGARDGSIDLLDAKSGELVRPLAPLTAQVRALCWSPDGTQLAAGADAAAVFIYSVDAEEVTVDAIELEAAPRALAFSRKGKLAVGGDDGVVRVFDLQTHEEVAALPTLGEPISAVAFSPAQDWVVSGVATHGGARLTPLRLR